MNDTLLNPSSDSLQDLWAARIADCFDPATGLFSRQIRAGAWAATLGTEAITSTAICMIGLSRAGIPIRSLAGAPADLCRAMALRILAQRYVGGIGLALWAASAVRQVAPLQLLSTAGLDPARLEREIPTLTTMEVAWLVSGLLHADHAALIGATVRALRELEDRLGPNTHTFRHASAAAPLRHRMRGRIANFADQVYPLQALSFAAIARSGVEHRKLADRCGAQLVAMQGPLGQWWWHHDALNGRVVEPFPVYSVHQHSMAPMALRALAEAGGAQHVPAIRKSRGWLAHNELGIDMADAKTGIVWRSIERLESGAAPWFRRARIAIARPAGEATPSLRLNREIRPYEWGWLLYAKAIEEMAIPPGHIV